MKNTDPIYEFYTSHPVPPPVNDLEHTREIWQDENVHRAEFYLMWPHKEYRADLDVLVAGCGTWQAAKYALCHPVARVVAIDISPASLECTGGLAKKYDLNNLELRQLPIENVSDLDHQFDLILCTGVLHHMADPDAGLRALRSVLKPDGAVDYEARWPGWDGWYFFVIPDQKDLPVKMIRGSLMTGLYGLEGIDNYDRLLLRMSERDAAEFLCLVPTAVRTPTPRYSSLTREPTKLPAPGVSAPAAAAPPVASLPSSVGGGGELPPVSFSTRKPATSATATSAASPTTIRRTRRDITRRG